MMTEQQEQAANSRASGQQKLQHAFLATPWLGVPAIGEPKGSAAGPGRGGEAKVSPSSDEERFRVLVENSRDLIAEVSLDGRLLYISPNVTGLLGYRAEELLGEVLFERVHPEDLPEVTRVFSLPEAQVTCRFQHKDGSWRWLETSGRDFLTGGGRETHGVLVARDATERMETERALRENQRVLATLLGNLPGMAYRSRNDADWTMEFASKGCLELTGYRPEELVFNRTVSYGKLILPRDRQRVWGEVQAALHARKPFELHYWIRDAHGDEKWVWERGMGVFSEGGALLGIEGLIIDRTERKRADEKQASLEARLRQAEKLEEIGTLAGGIAHDFNNVLALILTYTELAAMDAEQPQEVRRHLGQVTLAGHRARDMVRRILAFSSNRRQDMKPIDLSQTVGEGLKLLRAAIDPRVEIDERLDAGLPLVVADATQIHQVLLNLCANAAHAMRDRPGRLTVRLKECPVDAALAKMVDGLRTGRYLRLTVKDGGEGMDCATLKRIFEPFFTTKGPGQGTGLGLAVVRGIVREHAGAIDVQSLPGVGTTFDIYLPAETDGDKRLSAGAGTAMPGNGERVMVVDDEPAICQATRLLLEKTGYKVTTHTDPVRALEQFRAEAETYHLAIVDLTMPRMSGIDLAAKFRQLRPRLPVLMTSGQGAPTAPDQIEALAQCTYLSKPISHQMLATAIHHALAGSSVPPSGRGEDFQPRR